MASSSTVLTIGTAISRAEQHHAGVELLVSGVWYSGQVMGADGFGVVLATSATEILVFKYDAIDGVRVSDPRIAPEYAIEAATNGHVPATH